MTLNLYYLYGVAILIFYGAVLIMMLLQSTPFTISVNQYY